MDVVRLEFEGELVLGQEPLRASDAEELFLTIADEGGEADGAGLGEQSPALQELGGDERAGVRRGTGKNVHWGTTVDPQRHSEIETLVATAQFLCRIRVSAVQCPQYDTKSRRDVSCATVPRTQSIAPQPMENLSSICEHAPNLCSGTLASPLTEDGMAEQHSRLLNSSSCSSSATGTSQPPIEKKRRERKKRSEKMRC